MATRLYFHDSASTVTGTLPSTEQSSQTANFNFEAQTNNRSMDTTIGTAQASKTYASSSSHNNVYAFVTKFISKKINQSGISANTWTYNFAAKLSVLIDDYPTDDSHNLHVCCYVWRPSNGTKIGNIYDGSLSGYWDLGSYTGGHSTTAETAEHGTFSGSAVASAAANDVIVLEAWIKCYTDSTSTTFSYFYDGTTVNTTLGATVSNHASFLETPENITFVSDGTPIDMTQVSTKTYANKFITKV